MKGGKGQRVNKRSKLAIFSLICLIRKHLSDPLWSCHLGPLHSQLIPITEEDSSLITEAEEGLSEMCVFVCTCVQACVCVFVSEHLIVNAVRRVDVSVGAMGEKGSQGRDAMKEVGRETTRSCPIKANSHYIHQVASLKLP